MTEHTQLALFTNTNIPLNCHVSDCRVLGSLKRRREAIHPSEWIATGKLFDQINVPEEVQHVLEQLLSVPAPFNDSCVSPDFSIQTLLATKLPCLDAVRVSKEP